MRKKLPKIITYKEAIENLREYKKKMDAAILKRDEEFYKELETLVSRETEPIKEIKPFCPECGQFMHLLEGITHVAPVKNEYLMKFVCRTESCGLFEKPLRILFKIGEL